ncbi:MAG: hypothetical protein ACE5OW_03470 [Candidatus Bathyarchaeia archaeon]
MSKAIKGLLRWIIAGTEGGLTGARIILGVRETPSNTNQWD